MKVALVHDDLVQWGGAEKVLVALTELFSEAPIYTSVLDLNNRLIREQFGNKKIITSFIQKIPGWRNLYRPLLPLYPLAFEQFDFTDYDLVISQTTKFAKSIITKPETKHICLIHTPPRFLWNLPSDHTPFWMEPLLSYLRIYDQISARRVDHFIAGSYNCQKRLEKIYHISSDVVQPFVDSKLSQMATSFDGGYYLLVARLNEYKNARVVVETFNHNQLPLKIVGSGPESMMLQRIARDNISFYEKVSDNALASFLAGCKGIIVAAQEDFGMVALEAQLFGKGVIAYGRGGALETVIAGKTGVYFMKQTVESLSEAVDLFETLIIDPADCRKQVESFTLAKFQSNLKNIIQKLEKSEDYV